MKKEQIDSAKERYDQLAIEQSELMTKIQEATLAKDYPAVKRYKAELELCRKFLIQIRKILYG